MSTELVFVPLTVTRGNLFQAAVRRGHYEVDELDGKVHARFGDTRGYYRLIGIFGNVTTNKAAADAALKRAFAACLADHAERNSKARGKKGGE